MVRPKHWDRGETRTLTSQSRDFSQTNFRKRQLSLAAAVTGTTRPPNVEQRQLDAPATKRSLIPSFLPKPASTTARDTIQESSDLFPNYNESRRSTSPTSLGGSALSPVRSPLEPRRQLKKGPIAKRLQRLRDESRGDWLRLQSGQYPFSLKRSDRNDPRNRATSTCDITILGTPIGIGKLVVALCYIQSWESVSDDSSDPQGLAWAAFAVDTARQTNLAPGLELRVYNAVAVALEGNITVMMLCTQLSERYPSKYLKKLTKIELKIGKGGPASLKAIR